MFKSYSYQLFDKETCSCVRATRGTLDNGIFVYVLNSCGLVKVFKKKYCKFCVHRNKQSPSRETCQEKIVRRTDA